MYRLLVWLVALALAGPAFAFPTGTPPTPWNAPFGVVTASPYNWVPDQQTGTAVLTQGSPAIGGITTHSSDFGKIITVPGVGPNGTPWSSTIIGSGVAASAPSFSSGTFYAYGEACPIAPGGNGTGVVPGDTFNIGEGTFNSPTQCQAQTTGVYSLSVPDGGSGSGATAAQCIITGTTGTTNVKFSALVNIVGGGISGSAITMYPGQYTGNPANLNNEPVTSTGPGCGTLTGAYVQISMGINLAMITLPGNSPTNPAATQNPTSTTGAGTGVTFALPYAQAGAAWWGTDNSLRIKNTMASAPAGTLYVPAGTYGSICPPSTKYWPATNAVSLVGDGPGISVIQLAPWCKQPAQADLFYYFGLSGFRWEGITVDLNNATYTGYFGPTRLAGAAVLVGGTGQDVTFDRTSFINARSGQIGIQGFWGAGQTFDHFTVTNSRFTELTTQGNLSHALYVGFAAGGALTNLNASNNVAVGANIGIQANSGNVEDNDVCCQGYGGGINLGFGPTQTSAHLKMSHNRMHDANNGVEVGDADIPPGSESYCANCTFMDNEAWNNPGAGIKICAEHDLIQGNSLHDNGSATPGNQINGGVRWQLNAGILLYRYASAPNLCDANGTLIVGNRVYDSYTWAVANGYPATGLTPLQYYGYSTSGLASGQYGPDMDDILSANDLTYNVIGRAFINGSEIFDGISSLSVGSKSFFDWGGTTVANGTTNNIYGGITNETGGSQAASAPYPSTIRNLNVRIVTPAATSTVVATLFVGTALGNVAATAVSCTIPVNGTTCADTTDTAPLLTGNVYFVQITNNSSASTGQILIGGELDQIQ